MSELSSASFDKVKILVLGDSGVGKTSLVQLIANGQPFTRAPGWTAGCNVEVRWHEYAAGTGREQPYFVELWDIGGCQALQAVRPLFYSGAHGYILVHDMTNRKSLQNLKQSWLAELNAAASSIHSNSSVQSSPWASPGSPATSSNGAGSLLLPPQAPCLLVGNKLDLVTASSGDVLPLRKPKATWGLGISVTADAICRLVGGAEHITVDSHSAKCLAPGSSNAVALTRFFDKVIDTKLSLSNSGFASLNAATHQQNTSSNPLLTSGTTSSSLIGLGTTSSTSQRLSSSLSSSQVCFLLSLIINSQFFFFISHLSFKIKFSIINPYNLLWDLVMIGDEFILIKERKKE